MYGLLYKYFILHKKASIPGIGIFSVKRKPANLDFANKIFIAPDLQIKFSSDSAFTDNRFYAFISNEQNIDETNAVKEFTDFANNVKGNLTINKSVELPGLGTLSQNDEGKLNFQSAQQLQDYFPDITAERVVRQNIEHTILVGESNRTNTEMQEILATEAETVPRSKDYWWVYAIILAVISIAAIVYYYSFQQTN